MINKRIWLFVLVVVAILSANLVHLYAASNTTPSAPTLSFTPMTPTNGNVTVTIYYPKNASIKQYRLGIDGVWTTYYAPVVVTSNVYVYARYQNSSGYWSALGGYPIKNIDKTPPLDPTFSLSSIEQTNQDVAVTINFSEDSTNKQYKLESDSIWTSYTNTVLVSSNTTIYAKASDSVGNWTTIVSYSVSNIDKNPPSLPVLTADIVSPTNGNVNITVAYPDDAKIKQYRIGNDSNWIDYNASISITSNTEVYAKASDSAGNWSDEAIYIVNNIDKKSPDAPVITASTIEPTNKDVYLSISYSDDSSTKIYKVGETGTWTDYSDEILISSNTTIYAKAADNAGNWSDEVIHIVNNIDKVAPNAPVITASTTEPTNRDVYLSISYSDDSSTKLYKVGETGTWMDYSDEILIGSNTTIYAKAADNAGNWSDEVIHIINNIDKVAPNAPVITVSTTEPTNSDVYLSISYSDDSSTKLYKVGETGTWMNYSDEILIGSNTTIYSKAADNAGNWSDEISFSVGNIDKIAPDAPGIIASTTRLTDEPVIVSIDYSQDSVLRQYKIGVIGSWLDYTVPLAINTNTTVYARASDIVGNWSMEAAFGITNIRKTVMAYTVKNYSTDVSSYNSIKANTTTINEIATATFTVDGLGNLTGTAPVDQISYANSNGIRTKLMVSNSFDSAIAKQILESPVNRENLKNNIINLLKANNYTGVDIDIENIPASCRDYFTTFMSQIYNALKPSGYGVSVAVQPKAYDSPNATWNYAFDYKSLAQYTDYLMIMAYDEHYAGGTPGAVASINWVTSVIDYALTIVPKEKIILGMAAYGYDWGGTTTKAYSINGCYNLASQYGAVINFDTTSKSKYFTYSVNGISHTVWFEDGDTIAYKLDLANSRDLKGVGIWRLGLENPNYWITIKAKLNK